MKKQKGFTLIELLVVIAIIAILSTVVMAGLNSARMKGRDAKRLSDIKQVQTALELYYNDNSTYPTAAVPAGCTAALAIGATTAGANWNTAGSALATLSASPDFSVYMNPMPTPPTPGIGYCYIGGASTYELWFILEGQSGSLPLGAHKATPTGIQ